MGLSQTKELDPHNLMNQYLNIERERYPYLVYVMLQIKLRI